MRSYPCEAWIGQVQNHIEVVVLTYPQCGVSKQVVQELLTAKKNIQGMVIASEKHEDGSPHIHVFLLLKTPYQCVNSRFWDLHVGDTVYHGDYQKCRNIDDVVKYIKKDGDILEFGDIDWKEKINARKEHRKAVAKCLIDGTKTLAQAIDDDPTLLFGARHLKQDLETYHQAKIQPLEASDVRGIWIYGPRELANPGLFDRRRRVCTSSLKTSGLTATLARRLF